MIKINYLFHACFVILKYAILKVCHRMPSFLARPVAKTMRFARCLGSYLTFICSCDLAKYRLRYKYAHSIYKLFLKITKMKFTLGAITYVALSNLFSPAIANYAGDQPTIPDNYVAPQTYPENYEAPQTPCYGSNCGSNHNAIKKYTGKSKKSTGKTSGYYGKSKKSTGKKTGYYGKSKKSTGKKSGYYGKSKKSKTKSHVAHPYVKPVETYKKKEQVLPEQQYAKVAPQYGTPVETSK
jgi:hypothetical protein